MHSLGSQIYEADSTRAGDDAEDGADDGACGLGQLSTT
jgi:hypothetical protein